MAKISPAGSYKSAGDSAVSITRTSARDQETSGRRIIRALSEWGILLGTVESAGLPALYAATSPNAKRGGFYGPRGLGHMSGPPGEHKLYSPLRSAEDAQRIWEVSEELTTSQGRSTPGVETVENWGEALANLRAHLDFSVDLGPRG